MPPQRVNRHTFLARLRRSALLTPHQMAQVKTLLPQTERGRVLARELVHQGILTRFQAERLLIGRTDGFHLDKYVILEELGRGGMGRVYKARHQTMDRIVALKILSPELTETERAREMFLREVRAIAQLVHPNIVTAYDADKAEERYYLVLEFVDGPNLDQLLRTVGPLDVGLACDFVRQASLGLHCAHKAHMVHRDIKPANLLLQQRNGDEYVGMIKISDFGLARLHDPHSPETRDTILTRPNMVMGTPDFLSPEQARCVHDTDIRSDLYSLGCTFYFLLTGQPPFPGGTSLEKLIRHTTEEPTALQDLRPEIPSAIVAIVTRLMAKNPDDRFQTPEELANALTAHAVPRPLPLATAHPNTDSLPDIDEATAPVQEAPNVFADLSGNTHSQIATSGSGTALGLKLRGRQPRSWFRVVSWLLVLISVLFLILIWLAATS